MRRGSGRIGYVVNAFPTVSETFILNELRAMEAGGLPVVILALTRRRDDVCHAGLNEVSAPIIRPPAAGWRGAEETIRAHAALALRRPGAYAAAIVRERRHPLLRLAGWLAGAALRHGVVHLHAHYAKEPLEVAERVRRLTGIPYSFAAHAKDLYTTPPDLLSRRLRQARFAVACHAAGERRLRALAGPEACAEVVRVPHGIDTRLFLPRATAREPGLVLAVGRLTPKKGFDDLVRACARLRSDGRPFRCVIIGEGRLRGELQALVEAAGLGAVVSFLPFLTQEALAAWYARAAVVAVPSKVTADGNRDGLPNVAVEAMRCGAPVVATPVGGLSEVVIDGETGLLVPPEDPEALAAGIARILDDPRAAARLGRAAAAAVAGLDFRRTVEPLVDRFRALCASPVAAALEAARPAAWRPGGLAERAARRLGIAPRHDAAVEAAIARAVAPGLAANAWRPDLRRLAERRLWDEAFKAGRVEDGAAVAGRRVLDLGCGRGGLTVALKARGAEVVGLDLRRRNCAVTRIRGRRYGLSIPTVVARAEALPFSGGSFDLVCCLEMLEHAADPAALLAEIRRVLAPGGLCAVTVVNRFAHRDPHYLLWGVNFLPRALARRYIALRGRAKEPGRDAQALEAMHYFTYGRFAALARSLGFEVRDPRTPRRRLARLLHRASRRLSLGYNTAYLLLAHRRS
jgi:glycosyltransferase involved in cell wall biosynthesis/SAM-dependent methyltransferase